MMKVVACFVVVSIVSSLPAHADETAVKSIAENLDYLWVIIASALVFLMQPGFMGLESGLCRSKNSINVAIKNMADFIIASCGFWFIGFGLMFGKSFHGITGSDSFGIGIEDPWLATFFVFQAMFCSTAATIDSGALAERTKFETYLIISAITSIFIYPVFGHWAWGGLFFEDQQGWLEKLGFIDFAGSTVVHSVGGWMALVGIWVVGPRIGKFTPDGRSVKIAPSNLQLSFLGVFMLFFGWFGFNCGSTLTVTPLIGIIAINTILSACFSALTTSLISFTLSTEKKLECEMVINGLLGGLVAVTAGCASITPAGAIIIGIIAGGIVFYASRFIETVLKLDDVVDAVAVHGVCGAWGTMAVALFITDANLGSMTRISLLGVQTLGVLTCFAWTTGIGYIVLTAISFFMDLRVSPEAEHIGLNVSEHGAKSTLIDIASSMYRATTEKKFTRDLEVEPEFGTEIGDIAIGFNKMLGAIRISLEENFRRQQIVERQNKLIEHDRKQVEAHNKGLQIKISEATDIIRTAQNNLKGIINTSMEAETSVKQLGNTLQNINKIIVVLETLSQEINLTSLNALIEAAHAGKYGETFAVVANKVRTLSSDSRSATREIGKIIEEIYSKMEQTAGAIQKQSIEVENGRSFMNNAEVVIKDLITTTKNKMPEEMI